MSFRRPAGRLLADVPPPPAVPHDPVHTLRARNEASGLRLPARTAWPGWQGEHLDVGWAIDVLHPQAQRPFGRIESSRLNLEGTTAVDALTSILPVTAAETA